MDLWLYLPDGLEQVYWMSEATRHQVAVVDTYSIILGMMSHFITMFSMRRFFDNMALGVSGSLLAVQFLWLRRARGSYDRWRHHITLIQACRWIFLRYLLGIRRAGYARLYLANFATGPSQPRRKLQQFISITVLGPVYTLFGSMVHMLPWKFQWVAISVGTVVHLCGGCSQQVALLHAAGLEPMAQKVCYHINQLLLMPMASGQQRELCDKHGPAHVVLFVSLLVGCVVPLWVSYCVERAGKKRFIRQLNEDFAQDLLDGLDLDGLDGFDRFMVGSVLVWLAACVPCLLAVLFAEALALSASIS
jgi:hypothetical protein